MAPPILQSKQYQMTKQGREIASVLFWMLLSVITDLVARFSGICGRLLYHLNFLERLQVCRIK
jgi:hypothetical protein